MGYDYYIIKQLEVKHVGDDTEQLSYIELRRHGFYFPDLEGSQDSDDSTSSESNDARFNRIYGNYLVVNYEPRILFQNGKWKNDPTQEKYEATITSEIGNGLILSIIKKECRYAN